MSLVINTQQGQATLDKSPDSCPICHVAITPMDQGVSVQINLNDVFCVERVLRCPSVKCQRMFIARYTRQTTTTMYVLTSCVPTELVGNPQSETIFSISPDFCEIYKQADIAEQRELTLVAGPGFRKAL